MKKLNKMLAVALSLVLCLGMIAPAFAASFTELQGAIDSTENGLFGEKQDISASTDEQGNRNVTLLGDVVRGEDETNKSIVIDAEDGKVTIDLNGKNIDGDDKESEHAVVEVKGGDLTIKDSTAKTETDAEGNDVYTSGAVTGGNHEKVPGGAPGHGGGVSVTGGGSLTIESGAVKGNHAEESGGGVYVAGGTVTMNGGLIDDNYAGHSGGGVSVNAGATASDVVSSFTMNDGTISNNESGQGGAGIFVNVLPTSPVDKQDVPADRNFATLNGGAIKDNHTATDGGGVFITNGTLNLNGTEISGNTAGRNGAGMFITGGSEATMTGGSVTGNNANLGGGGLCLNNQAKFTMTGGEFYNNSAASYADDIYKVKGTTLKLSGAALMNVVGADGKPITGWYWDNSQRWSNETGNSPYSDVSSFADGVYAGQLLLKAAHDKYFNVEYTDGADGSLFDSQKYEVENKSAVPMFEGEIPARPGYNFVGWQVDGENFDPETGTVTGTLILVARWEAIPAVEIPDGGDTGTGTEIDEPAVPLAAGPVTRAEFLDYLWRHEGEPESDGVCAFEDVPEDHPFILALAWAEQNGIAFANEDGTFQPDELVTVGAVREFLNNFAQAFGTNAVAAAGLASLSGDDDEAVLNCDEVLAEFFGEEYAAPSEHEAA